MTERDRGEQKAKADSIRGRFAKEQAGPGAARPGVKEVLVTGIDTEMDFRVSPSRSAASEPAVAAPSTAYR